MPCLFCGAGKPFISGQASARDFKVPLKEPEASVTTVRNLINLYEVPMLFYVVCLALYAVNGVRCLP